MYPYIESQHRFTLTVEKKISFIIVQNTNNTIEIEANVCGASANVIRPCLNKPNNTQINMYSHQYENI